MKYIQELDTEQRKQNYWQKDLQNIFIIRGGKGSGKEVRQVLFAYKYLARRYV